MTNEEEIKVWMDLCDKHARLLTDEEDYEEAIELEEIGVNWSCSVKNCKQKATVQGLVRMKLSPKKKEAVA